MQNILRKVVLIALMSTLVLTYSFAEPSNWAKESVEKLKETNLYKGDVYSNFQEPITREEFIYLAVRLYEAIKGDIVVNENISFTDTTDIYALKGASLGITSGVGNGKFAPSASLTREQLAVLMVKTLKLADIELIESDDYKFSDDVNISTWARENVYLAKKNNIIGGVGDNNFNSQGIATKEQSLSIIWRIIDENADDLLAHIIDIYKGGKDENSDEFIGYNVSAENPLTSHKELFKALEKYGNVSGGSSENSYENSVIEITGSQMKYNGATLADLESELSVKFYTEPKYQSSDGHVFVSVVFSAYSENIKNVFYDMMESTLGEAIAKEAVFSIAKDIESTKNEKTYNTDTLDGKIKELSNVKIEYVAGANYLECIVYFKK